MDGTSEATWPEILGSKNWDNLLDPLDLSLRKLILRCGDFCQATYDAFNNDQNSRYCGTSRYGKRDFFHKVMLEKPEDYQVSSFLYATARVSLPEAFLLHSLSRDSWDRETNWIGYIAVSSDEQTKTLGRREIYIVFRGTTRNYEWIDILGAKLKSAKPLLRGATSTLHDQEGTSSSDDDDDKVPKVMLGWLTMYISDDPDSRFTKLSARAQLLVHIKALRERYKDDDLSIIFTGHSLGASLSILSAFDLAMLHIVAGWNGEDQEFELKVKRSLALVNKSSEFLKDECLVPGIWWVEKNKGMVRNEDGEWVLAPPDEENLPVPEC
ncbi:PHOSPHOLIPASE A1-IIGAMMA [Salix koriyanagi]|uniref:Phospholipase A1 n=1 Tax=Salix koriyanagi TaxID=2511006 RepID=A0A9Q0T056_9ROSI|nr:PHOSPHOLIPASE A1-IIGAMMA [Salix koriyanagi]KAJ6695746.1 PHOSPHOLIPASE A1-IIGAMMA [Salix koriyanagi]